jgi:hypothetical protein
MFEQRLELLRNLEAARDSKVMLYVTGDRSGAETVISADSHDFFVAHLDRIGVVNRISLVLYTPGGQMLAAWGLVNLLRLFCDELEIIVPAKAHSAGTLMVLGANKVVMTKQATLGPIDPAIIPQIGEVRTPVRVESVTAFLDFARDTLGPDADLTPVFLNLAAAIPPTVLGDMYRSRSQIRMLGDRLLSTHLSDPDHKRGILDFLCSESGSHDYTINRREAANLHLPIEHPSPDLYRVIKALYDDFADELDLTSPLDFARHLGVAPTASYMWTRALIESIEGSHRFISSGQLSRTNPPDGQAGGAIQDERPFEGWRYHPSL